MPRVAAIPDVRQAILDASTSLMERHGFKKMTIDDIAHEAGIGKATIYGYFENKQEVGLAVIEGYQARVRVRQREILAEPLDPRQKLRRIVSARVMMAFEIAGRYRQSFDESMAALKPLVLRRRGRFNEQEAEIVAQVIRDGVAQGLFRSVDPLEAARTILTCVSGLMPYSLSPRELSQPNEVSSQADRVLDLVLEGLVQKPSEPVGKRAARPSRNKDTAFKDRN